MFKGSKHIDEETFKVYEKIMAGKLTGSEAQAALSAVRNAVQNNRVKFMHAKATQRLVLNSDVLPHFVNGR